MGKIWYESHFHLRFAYFLPFIVLGGTILCFVLEIRELKKKDPVSEQGIKIAKIFFSGMIAFESILIFIAIISQIDMYKETAIAYQNGDYQIVEGYVENFVPMGGSGWEPEKFEINGVKFEYSDARLISGGYYRAKGDCIIADGQHLKVGYIYSGRDWGNIIVYIEELP